MSGLVNSQKHRLSDLWRQKESESFVWVIGEMPASGCDLKVTAPMQEGDRQITQGGHHLRRVAGAQARAVLPKGDIADIMQRVLVARQEGSLPPARLQNRT